MPEVTEERRDIIDAGTLTIPGEGTVTGGWLSTEGITSVAAVVVLASGAVSAQLQESNDQSEILYNWGLPGSAPNFRVTAQPACAFIRFWGHGSEGGTLDYSIRALG